MPANAGHVIAASILDNQHLASRAVDQVVPHGVHEITDLILGHYVNDTVHATLSAGEAILLGREHWLSFGTRTALLQNLEVVDAFVLESGNPGHFSFQL